MNCLGFLALCVPLGLAASAPPAHSGGVSLSDSRAATPLGSFFRERDTQRGTATRIERGRSEWEGDRGTALAFSPGDQMSSS